MAQAFFHMVFELAAFSLLGFHVNGFESSWGKKTPHLRSSLCTKLIYGPKLAF